MPVVHKFSLPQTNTKFTNLLKSKTITAQRYYEHLHIIYRNTNLQNWQEGTKARGQLQFREMQIHKLQCKTANYKIRKDIFTTRSQWQTSTWAHTLGTSVLCEYAIAAYFAYWHIFHIFQQHAHYCIFPQKFALSTAITTTTSLKMMQHKARISSKYISLQYRRGTNDEKTNRATLYLLASSATEPQAVSTKHHIIIIASSICHADALVSTHTRARASKQIDTKWVILETFPQANLNQKKCTSTQNKHKNKAGLVAFYNYCQRKR